MKFIVIDSLIKKTASKGCFLIKIKFEVCLYKPVCETNLVVMYASNPSGPPSDP